MDITFHNGHGRYLLQNITFGFLTSFDGQGVLMNFVACIIVIHSLTKWQIEI
jgi:hypothetical protein